MMINFSVNYDDSYVVVTCKGKITDQELLDAYVEFYRGDEWFPTLNELSDLSQADTTEITSSGLQNLANFAQRIQKQHNISSPRVAIFAPDPLPFGLARMYDCMTAKLPRQLQIFRNLQDAEDWLKTYPYDPKTHTAHRVQAAATEGRRG